MTAQPSSDDPHPPGVLIGVVGVCASGKSTLINKLSALGYRCRHIAQEHSYVQEMWKLITNPDILVYLEVSYEVTLKRKKLNWTIDEYREQLARTRNAFEHADIRVQTDTLTPDELVEIVTAQIDRVITRSNHHS
jgi:thymidylate kinase